MFSKQLRNYKTVSSQQATSPRPAFSCKIFRHSCLLMVAELCSVMIPQNIATSRSLQQWTRMPEVQTSAANHRMCNRCKCCRSHVIGRWFLGNQLYFGIIYVLLPDWSEFSIIHAYPAVYHISVPTSGTRVMPTTR